MVWQLLAKPLLGVATDAVKGFVETKKAKAELLQYMVNLHRGNPYTKLAMRKKSGGIVSLVGG